MALLRSQVQVLRVHLSLFSFFLLSLLFATDFVFAHDEEDHEDDDCEDEEGQQDDVTLGEGVRRRRGVVHGDLTLQDRVQEPAVTPHTRSLCNRMITIAANEISRNFTIFGAFFFEY